MRKEKDMRTKNSLKNVIASMLSNIITIIIGVVAQAIFIKILGSEYLGLNSLFSNIISMLAIVEMGIGNAIIFNLYKPIANNEIEKIKSLMYFYKKSYRIIASIVLIIGIIIIPMIPFIVDVESVTVDINIYLVYILFLLDTVFSYFLSYKRSILYANQKNYIVNIIHILYTVIMNLLQIFILFISRNYYLYLIVKIVMRILENIVITIVANKKYEYLKENNIEKLDKNIESDIFKKIKAMFFHKIGSFVVLGTDNIIISKFLGLVTVGMYSNYYLIINSVQTIFNQVVQSTTASIGNLLVTENKEKHFQVFDRIRFLNFWISTFAGVSILIIMSSFIKIWIGESYILPGFVLIVLVINYYLNSTRSTYIAFKDAACIYYEDRFVPILESIINIIASVVLVRKFGLAGVFIGTIISGMVLWLYSYPKYVYKKLFDRKYREYFKETIIYFLIFIAVGIITMCIANKINFSNIYLQFLANLCICTTIPNILLIVIFFKNDNFKYYIDLLKNKFK